MNAFVFECLRAMVVLLPAGLLVWHFTYRRYATRVWAGVLLAYMWQLQWRMVLYASGVGLGLWQFRASDIALYGVPVDMVLGTSLALGALSALGVLRLGLVVVIALDAIWVGFILLESASVWAYALMLLVSFVVIAPSLWLARWTSSDRHLYWRAALQPLCWVLLYLWFFPSVFFQITGDSWSTFLSRPLWLNALFLLILSVPGGMIVSALYVFAVYGEGTGFPYDPPKRLVTSGVYRYISNPMQLGIVLLMGGWGLILQSTAVAASSLVALLLFVVFKDVCNGSCQIGRQDPAWQRYQRGVGKWIPRLKRGV